MRTYGGKHLITDDDLKEIDLLLRLTDGSETHSVAKMDFVGGSFTTSSQTVPDWELIRYARPMSCFFNFMACKQKSRLPSVRHRGHAIKINEALMNSPFEVREYECLILGISWHKAPIPLCQNAIPSNPKVPVPAPPNVKLKQSIHALRTLKRTHHQHPHRHRARSTRLSDDEHYVSIAAC